MSVRRTVEYQEALTWKTIWPFPGPVQLLTNILKTPINPISRPNRTTEVQGSGRAAAGPAPIIACDPPPRTIVPESLLKS